MKKYILLLFAGCLMACNESYPGIYVDEEEQGRPSDEVIKDSVPIMLGFIDPEYSIITRGIGALEDWSQSENREMWRKIQLHVYAFLDQNHDFQGEPDYSVTKDSFAVSEVPYCLVYDRKVKIEGNVEPSLSWVDPVPYYNLQHPDYKYNFFACYLDDARCLSEEHLKDKVVKNIEIDGTQDIITAFAEPTQRQIEQIQSDDEFKYIAAYWENLIYSTRTGNRGISPVFHLSHEMARFKFKVVGATDKAGEFLVEAVSVTTPRKGAATIAAQPQNGVPPLGIVWDESSRSKVYLATDQTPHTFGATLSRENACFDPLIQVGKGDTVELGSIMLPAVETFSLQIEYKLLQKPESGYFTANYQTVALKEGSFQKGTQYEVVLKVYGPQSIDLQIDSESMGWIDGGTLPPIDEDNP